MATEVVHVIDPDMGAGYDYDSLFDWEAAEQGDLTGVRDEIAVAMCRCTGGTADSTRVTLDGWTTSATQYIKIWTDPAESYRHSGKKTTGNVYRFLPSVEFGAALSINESYVVIDGLIIENAHANGHNAIEIMPLALADNSLISIFNSVIIGGKRSANGYGIRQTDAKLLLVNSIIYGASVDGFENVFSSNGPPITNIYNCTVCGNTTDGIVVRNESASSVKNCYSGGNGGVDYSGKAPITSASEDTTGTSGLQEIAYSVSAGAYFTNITAGSEDFHIGASSALIGAGTNLYNDATYAFQTDIDGDDRGGSGATWDIGADQYIALGAALPRRALDGPFHGSLRGSVR